MKIKGQIAHYHIISRTVGQQFLLGDNEKEALVQIIRYYSQMYFVKVNAYCVMSNHFHLVIQSLPERLFSDDEVVKRIKAFMQKNNKEVITPHTIHSARERLEDISEFCRSFKQTFSSWYNRTHNRTGYLWGSRFKSLYLGNQESIQRCCAYIELNPVRAGIVQKPETYRWCSLHNRQFARHSHRFCSFDGVFANAPVDLPENVLLREYRALVYYCGNIKRTDNARAPISDHQYSEAARLHVSPPRGELMLGRIRYFTDGMAIGSKQFLKQVYKQFAGTAILKKNRNLYPTGISPNLFSIKRLRPKHS